MLCLTSGLAAGADGRWVRVEGGNWSPQAETLTKLRNALEPFVSSQAKIRHRSLREWRTYTFQYQGRRDNAKRYVFINAVCSVDGRWRLDKEMVLVLDGGTCFFNLKFDPRTAHFYDLHINGEA